MNKTVIAVVVVVAVACLIGLYIWSSHNRFYTTGSQDVTYEVDRKTGKSWVLAGVRKILQQREGESHKKEEELPFAAASQVTGNTTGLSLNWMFDDEL